MASVGDGTEDVRAATNVGEHVTVIKNRDRGLRIEQNPLVIDP